MPHHVVAQVFGCDAVEWSQKFFDGLVKLIDVLTVVDPALDLSALELHQIKVVVSRQEMVRAALVGVKHR